MFMSTNQREGQEGRNQLGSVLETPDQDGEADKMFHKQQTQLVSEPTREGIPLELLFVSGEGWCLGPLWGIAITILILGEGEELPTTLDF